MNKAKIFKFLFSALLIAIISSALIVAISAQSTEAKTLYELTLADDSVVKITEQKNMAELVALSPKAIKLYSDVEIPVVGSNKSVNVSWDLDIDLNNFTIKAVGGYLRPDRSNAKVTVHGGKIDHSSAYFVFVSGNGSIEIDDCEISAATNFVHLRDGSLTIKNSVIKNSSKTGNFVQLSYAGATSDVMIDNCDFSEYIGVVLNIGRNSGTKTKTMTIKDTVIDKASAVTSFSDQSEAQGTADIAFTGSTKISSKMVGTAPTLTTTSYTFAPGVKLSEIPYVAGANICYADGGTGFDANTDSDKTSYPYVCTKSDVFYKLITTDGTEINVSEKKSFSEILANYGEIKAIKLYSDIEINAIGTSKANYVSNDLDIDLNGKTITANGGYIYATTGIDVTIHSGNISHSTSYVAFVTLNSSLNISDCSVSSGSAPFHLRNGKVVCERTTFTSATAGSVGIFQLSYAGATTELMIDGCTFDGLAQPLLNIGRNESSISKTVTVKDTVFTSSTALLSFSDQTGAVGDFKITFTGNTKLSYNKFISTAPTLDSTSFIFDDGVMTSSVPMVSVGSISYLSGADGFIPSGDPTHPYVVADSDPKYTVKKSDGSLINVFSITPLHELIKLCDNGSRITFYADLDVTAEMAAADCTSKNLEIDLNGYTLTNSGARIRFYGSSKVRIFGGKIADTVEKQFFFTGGATTDKALDITFEDCEILAQSSFIQLRNGSLTFKNCQINAQSASVLIAVSTEGYESNLTFDGCSIALNEANLFNIARSSKTESHTVTVRDSEISTAGTLFTFGEGEASAEAVTSIKILGDTKLKYKYFERNTNANENTTIEIALGVKMSAPPIFSVGTLKFTEGGEGIVENDDSVYKYAVAENISISVKPKFSLTLYTDFTLNLAFADANHGDVISVKLGDKALESFVSGGLHFYQIKGISPIEINEKQNIELTYLNYGMTVTKTLSYSVLDYVTALLDSDYSTESKEMVCRALDYSASVFEYVGEDVPEELLSLMSSEKYTSISNSGWVNEIPESVAKAGTLFEFIDEARIVIDSGVRFRFYLSDDIGNGEIIYQSRTSEGKFTVAGSLINGKNYFEIDMRALDLYDGAVSISFGDYSGAYDFKAYASSDEVKTSRDELLKPLLVSMYNYFREANEYYKVKDKDFKPTATVVLRDGKSGTVTYILDDGDAATGEYTKIFLRDYENLKLTYGLIAEKYATPLTVYNEEIGKYEYVFDENGNYIYAVNESASELWLELVSEFGDRVEYTSHTLTHDFPGYNDEGGTITYVTSGGELKTATLPVGSATAEVYASIQILSEIFGVDVKTIVEAGVPAKEGDTIVDGVVYPGYYRYYTELIKKAYEEGLIVGARGGGFGEVAEIENNILTYDILTDLGTRLDLHAYSLRHSQTPESWISYIDAAKETGGWALVMMHRVYSDDTTGKDNVIHLKESQMRYLFSYTDTEDVWVANFTEATKYYFEWSTASVDVSYDDGRIIVNLTDKENNEIYDEALTVKVTVPESWTACLVDGVETKVKIAENGESYVYVNVVPDSGSVEIVSK